MNPMEESAHRTVAWFGSLDQVRAVEVDLERRGIDAVHVSVPSVDVGSDRREIDRRTAGWLGRRGIAGAVIGALVGAAIGLLLGLLLGDSGAEVAAFTLGGAVFGIWPGGFYGVATQLPAEPEVLDTFAVDTPGDTWIAVSGPGEVRRRAADVFRDHEPRKLVEA
jgi:hypothetical protein